MLSKCPDVRHITSTGSTVVSTPPKEEESGQADEMVGKLEEAGAILPRSAQLVLDHIHLRHIQAYLEVKARKEVYLAQDAEAGFELGSFMSFRADGLQHATTYDRL